MAQLTFKGNPVTTTGELPATGTQTPGFKLTNGDLADVSLADFAGKKVVLNIFPSIDTPVCAASVRRFNEAAGNMRDTKVLCISADLPFASGRFCAAEGLKNVVMLSTFRSPEFGKNYGVQIATGPLRALLSRAVIVIDGSGTVLYTEQVAEITDEPDYNAALRTLV
ncbi:MAG: thiol peroxidase [Kiritimatiellae bacterium]|nr:thiol peroxidase [Kiritimatiellia bacterium]